MSQHRGSNTPDELRSSVGIIRVSHNHSLSRQGSPEGQASDSPIGGNGHFAKLPVEVRVMVWKEVLICEEAIYPCSKRGGEIFYTHNKKGQETTKMLSSLINTCGLFEGDQKEHLIFYKENQFSFANNRHLKQYLTAIGEEKRHLLRSISMRTFCWDELHACSTNQRTEELLRIHVGKGLKRFEIKCSSYKQQSIWRDEKLATSIAQLLFKGISALPALEELRIVNRPNFRGSITGITMTKDDFSCLTDNKWVSVDLSEERSEVDERVVQGYVAVWEHLKNLKRQKGLPMSVAMA